jgi:predicted ABC-type ATPase
LLRSRPANTELYIVEGDSAGGSAKQGRDRRYQAILPIRGKLINVEKARLDKVLQNTEIRTMITAIGTGIGDGEGEGAFDFEKLRYHKIIIMTDADVDGSHIRTLLIDILLPADDPAGQTAATSIIAQPPLYQVTRKKRVEYVDDDVQMNKILIQLGSEDVRLRDLATGKELSEKQLAEILDLLDHAGQIRPVPAPARRRFRRLCRAPPSANPRTAPPPGQGARRQRRIGPLFPHRGGTGRIRRPANPDLKLFGAETDTGRRRKKSDKTAQHPPRQPCRTARKQVRHGLDGQLASKGLNVAHYAAQDQPLFELIEGEGERASVKPLFSIAEILAGVKEAGKRGIQIKRFKGLGEMNAKELFDTTMNPDNRKLLRIDMTDVVEAEEMFTKLMGDEVEPRRQFIEDNALNVRNWTRCLTFMPTLYLIAGPNGAGKTTFASRFLPEESGELEFVNVDLIARGLSPFAPEAAAGEAGRIALTRVGRLIRERKTFAWETTLSGRTIKGWVQKARAAGYFIKLVFVWIQSLEASIDRIRRRVREGGHNVPVPDVRRRFLKTLRNFFNDFCPLADSWKLFDNSKDSLRLVAVQKNGRTVVRDHSLWSAVLSQAGVVL